MQGAASEGTGQVTLTLVQERLLTRLAAVYARYDAARMRRVGKPYDGSIQFIPSRAEPRASLEALEAAGLVTIERHKESQTRLRRGSYGRWTGGTVTHEYTELLVRPTDAGLALAEALLAARA